MGPSERCSRSSSGSAGSDRMEAQYPDALAYLEQFEKQLRSRAAFKRYFTRKQNGQVKETGPFWSMFNVGDYTLAEHKVVWKDIAGDFAAAVLSPGEKLPPPRTRRCCFLARHPTRLITSAACSTAFQLAR